MQNASNEYNLIANSSSAKYFTVVKLDGNEINFPVNDFKYEGLMNPNGQLTIGSSCSSIVTFSIYRPDIRLENREVEILQKIDGADDLIRIGKFLVRNEKNDGEYSDCECVDFMTSKAEMPYFSSLELPTNSVAIINDICHKLGIGFATSLAKGYPVTKTTDGYTYREIIGYMAALHGCNAIINRNGDLEFRWYSSVNYTLNSSRIYQGGVTFATSKSFVVGKITCSVRDDADTSTITAGDGATGILIENPYMTQEILNDVYAKIKNFTFRALTAKCVGDFRLDLGDIVTVMKDGVEYPVPIMQIVHESDGGAITTIRSIAQSDLENTTTIQQGPITKAMERYYSRLVLIDKAMINKLDVDTADIKYATIYSLDAVTSKIGIIENTYLKTQEADIKYATINNLDVATGRIRELETNALTSNSALIRDLTSDVADINTLMFGSASGGSLITEFSNSIVSLIGDAQIKSAMIQDLNVDKLTGERISTTKLDVSSDSGQLVIRDNTISIKDATRVRVQIGKDANNDYNMYVFDKSGNVMFDALGLTAQGITRKIIRDDVVQDNANINASKLDISSLFTEINGSTQTIKGSRILLDTEGQTLDVAFKNMSTTVSSKVTSTEVQNIASAITDNAVNGLEIGVRNCIRRVDKDRSDTLNGYTFSEFDNTDNSSKRLWRLYIDKSWDIGTVISVSIKYSLQNLSWDANKNTQLFIQGDGNVAGWNPNLVGNITSGTYVIIPLQNTANDNYSTSGVVRFQITLTEKYFKNDWFNIGFRADYIKSGTMRLYEACAYASDKYLDYIPAPEDTDASISSVKSTADNAINTASTAKDTATTAKTTADTATAKLTTLTTTVQTQGTQLTAVQGQINSKVWQQDITTAVDSLEIGVRNLLRNSKGPFKPNFYLDTQIDNFALYPNSTIYLEQGKTYVITGKTNGNFTNIHASNVESDNCTIWVHDSYAMNVSVILSTGSTGNTGSKFVWSKPTGTYILRVNAYHPASTNTIQAWEIKITEGDKASTDWTPALEDFQVDIDALEGTTTTLTNSYTSLNQTVSSLSATVAKNVTDISKKADGTTVTNLFDRVTNMQADLNGFKTTVSDTYTTKNEFNSLQIGVKNLLRRTKDFSGTTDTIGQTIQETYQGLAVRYYKNTNETNYSNFGHWSNIVVLPNTEYTLSFWAKGTGVIRSFLYPDAVASGHNSDGNHAAVNDGNIRTTLTKEWKRYWITWKTLGTVPEKVNVLSARPDVNQSVEVWLCGCKLEQGNKATPWTPAPEDFQSDIDATNTNLTTVSNRVASLTQDLTGFKTTVSNTYTTKSELDNKLSAYSTVQNTNSLIQQTSSSILQTVQGSYTSKTEFNGLEIGVKNLLTGTKDWNGNLNTWYNTGSWIVDGSYNGLIVRKKMMAWNGIYQAYNVKQGETYTFSAYIKAQTQDGIQIFIPYDDNATVDKTNLQLDKSEDWKRFSITFKVMKSGKIAPRVEKNGNNGTVWVCGYKLEQGNKATPWTPAPEDLDDKITKVEGSLELKIDKDKLVSELNATADTIRFTSNNFILNSTNTKIQADGTLITTNGKIADFVIDGHGLNTLNTERLHFVESDLNYMQQIIMGNIQPTEADYDKYDLDNNREIDIFDIARVQAYLAGTWDGTRTTEIDISSMSYRNIIQLTRKTINDVRTTKIGAGNISTGAIDVENNVKAQGVVASAVQANFVYANTYLQADKVLSNWLFNKSAGSFGFGDTSSMFPNYWLSINGPGKFGGDCVAQHFITDSDRNLKTHIRYLSEQESADFIMSLKPVAYTMRNGESGREHHGFYAQDVKESMGNKDWGLYVDNAIKHMGTGKKGEIPVTNKALRYEELIADLIATVQYQSKRIDGLNSTIVQLNNRIMVLES